MTSIFTPERLAEPSDKAPSCEQSLHLSVTPEMLKFFIDTTLRASQISSDSVMRSEPQRSEIPSSDVWSLCKAYLKNLHGPTFKKQVSRAAKKRRIAHLEHRDAKLKLALLRVVVDLYQRRQAHLFSSTSFLTRTRRRGTWRSTSSFPISLNWSQ